MKQKKSGPNADVATDSSHPLRIASPLSLRNRAALIAAVLLVDPRHFHAVGTVSVTLERRCDVVFAVPVELRRAFVRREVTGALGHVVALER